MNDERLSLAELKERGKALGYTKILRRQEIAPIALRYGTFLLKTK
jgi:hypothetical protein